MVFQPRALRYMYVIKIINGKCFRLRNVGVMTMKNLHFLDLVVSKISTNCHIGLVVCCILFYVLFGNYAVILRRIDYRWKAAKLGPLLDAYDFDQGGIIIVPHLLWHGTFVFPVSIEGPPHQFALLDKQVVLMTYSKPKIRKYLNEEIFNDIS